MQKTKMMKKGRRKTRHVQIAAGIACLLVACTIYLVMRSKSIALYQWCRATVGTALADSMREATRGWAVPDFVRYSLPDGLYCLSYILIADAIWSGSRQAAKYIVVAAIPAAALLHETMQLAGLARGTFDWADVACYALPLAAYFLYQATQVSEIKVRRNHFSY